MISEALLIEEIFPEVAWKRKESKIVNTDDWYQIITPEAPTIALNGIYRSILDEKTFEESILAVIGEYKYLNLPFRWIIGPSSKPSTLESKLIEYGFQLNSEISGMVATSNEIRAHIAPNISVETVDVTTLDDYLEASSSGWSIAGKLKTELRKDLFTSIQSQDQTLIYCLARYKGTPAGAAALKLTSRSAHLIGGSVHPDFRKRGVYQSLVAYRTNLAVKLGKSLITTHAIKTTSAPLCEKMGLREVASFKMLYLP